MTEGKKADAAGNDNAQNDRKETPSRRTTPGFGTALLLWATAVCPQMAPELQEILTGKQPPDKPRNEHSHTLPGL